MAAAADAERLTLEGRLPRRPGDRLAYGARQAAAQVWGVAGGDVSQALRLVDEAPDLALAVQQGQMGLRRAVRILRERQGRPEPKLNRRAGLPRARIIEQQTRARAEAAIRAWHAARAELVGQLRSLA